MIVVTYLVAIIGFYIAYLISAVIFGRIFISIRRAFSNPYAELEGFSLLFASSLSTQSSFSMVSLIFIWFNYEPNWYIITPLMVAVWFFFTPALYRPHFSSGAAHWGMLIGVVGFLLTISNL